MKKFLSIALLAVLLITVMPVGAFAAGKLEVTQENFFVTELGSIYGYCFARIENTGDKRAEYSAGLFEIYDANGDTLTSESYMSVLGDYLEPGEYGYVSVYESIDNASTINDVDDYMLTVTGKSSSGTVTQRFACESEWLPDYQVNNYWTSDLMTATFTNTTDETIYDVDFALALLDDDGNILDIEYTTTYDIGVAPGSSITVREEVSSYMMEAIEREGFTPTHVDAFAYVYIDEE